MCVPLFGAVEAGGTKFLCAVGTVPENLSGMVRIETTDPDRTLEDVIDYFRSVERRGRKVGAVGIASFGPAEIDETSPRWGSILATPKQGWSHCDVAQRISRALRVPVGFDTDVNSSALAELRWGAGMDARSMAYVTVGTGIGGGFVVRGSVLHGARHPEIGHILVRRHPSDSAFAGTCPFHGDCLEGLASGPAIKSRWGASLSELPIEHEAHDIVAWYLAQLVVAIQAFVAPERIVMGGGGMQTPGLLGRIQKVARGFGAGYFGDDTETDDNGFLCLPRLGDKSGLLGGICLAEAAILRASSK